MSPSGFILTTVLGIVGALPVFVSNCWRRGDLSGPHLRTDCQLAGSAWFSQSGRELVADTGDIVIADPNVPFLTSTPGTVNFRIWRMPTKMLDPLRASSDQLMMTCLQCGILSRSSSMVGRWHSLGNASKSNCFNTLPGSLGKACLIDLHGVSERCPKPIFAEMRCAGGWALV